MHVGRLITYHLKISSLWIFFQALWYNLQAVIFKNNHEHNYLPEKLVYDHRGSFESNDKTYKVLIKKYHRIENTPYFA